MDSKPSRVDNIISRIAWALIVGAVSGLNGWNIWLTFQVMEQPTFEEARQIVKNEAPYIEDRKLIHQRLDESRLSNENLVKAIQRNTEVINELRIELARLRSAREESP